MTEVFTTRCGVTVVVSPVEDDYFDLEYLNDQDEVVVYKERVYSFYLLFIKVAEGWRKK